MESFFKYFLKHKETGLKSYLYTTCHTCVGWMDKYRKSKTSLIKFPFCYLICAIDMMRTL